MKICTKSTCPNRLSIGGENDVDAIPSACLMCNKLVYSSESKSKLVWLYLKLFLIFFFMLIFALILWSNIEYLNVKNDPSPYLVGNSTSNTDRDSSFDETNSIDSPFSIKEHIPDVLKFLKEFYRQGDDKNIEGQLSKFNFDVDKYYETGLRSQDDVSKSIINYYSNVIKYSTTNFYTDSLHFIGGEYYGKNDIDSLYKFSYPLLYEFETNNKTEKLRLKINVKLVRVGQKWKIKSIEEVERNVVSIVSGNPKKDINGKVKRVVKPNFEWNCPTWNKNFGDPCNDNNSNTVRDKITLDCKCEGQSKVDKTTTYYFDEDGDGLVDINIEKKMPSDSEVALWKDSAKGIDQCPRRPGNALHNGCPELQIKSISDIVYVDSQFPVEADPKGLLPADKLDWYGTNDLKFDDNQGRNTFTTCNAVGYHIINYKVINDKDPIASIAKRRIHVSITNEQIKDLIKPLIVEGSKPGGSGSFKEQSLKAMNELFKHTKNKTIEVKDELGVDRDPLETFLTVDLRLGLPTGKFDLDIIDIGYDTFDSNGSGKIDVLYVKFK
jgi:hypothetical protein